MKKYIIISLILGFYISQSCSDEFFDTPPLAAETEASFYSTIDNLESATIGCYSMLQAQGNVDLGHMMITGSIAGDDMEAGGRDAAEIPGIQNVDRMLHTPVNARIEKIWGFMYKGIYFCNSFLKYMPELNDGSLTPANVTLLNTRVGEVRFLRALYYHLLTQAFGGVVLLNEPALISEMKSATRASVKNIYSLIETDLLEAIQLLPTKNNTDAPGRASKEAAQALLAKVLLYESSYAKYNAGDERFGTVEERWGEALSYAEQVIASTGLRLLGLNGTETFSTFWSPNTDAYRYIFTVEGDNQPGSIFEIQDIMDLNARWLQTRGNGLTSWTTFRNYVDPAGGEDGFGWGWMTPTQALKDIFEDGDPRIKTTFGDANDSALVAGTDQWEMLAMGYSPTGYCLRKYECSPEQYWEVNGGDWNRGPINEKLIRLADIYLIAAEAAFESGNTTSALNYVNTVRRRADMCDGSEDGIPSQLTSVTLNDIRDERRRELTGEGHRFYDLVRWGIAEEVLSDLPLVGGSFSVSYQSPKHDFFPIPQTEIDVVGGTLQQYEGW